MTIDQDVVAAFTDGLRMLAIADECKLTGDAQRSAACYIQGARAFMPYVREGTILAVALFADIASGGKSTDLGSEQFPAVTSVLQLLVKRTAVDMAVAQSRRELLNLTRALLDRSRLPAHQHDGVQQGIGAHYADAAQKIIDEIVGLFDVIDPRQPPSEPQWYRSGSPRDPFELAELLVLQGRCRYARGHEDEARDSFSHAAALLAMHVVA